jgi:hypothetical protein
MEYPDLKRAVHEQAKNFKASTIPHRRQKSGAQLIQELLREGLHAITRYEPKLERLCDCTNVTQMFFIDISLTARLTLSIKA